MKKEYFLCSKEIIDLMSPEEQSPYLDRFGEDVCIAFLDFPKLEEKYKLLEEEHPAKYFGWCREITRANTYCGQFSLSEGKKRGLFNWIIEEIGASTEKNVAAIIGEICYELDITPIELFNKVEDI